MFQLKADINEESGVMTLKDLKDPKHEEQYKLNKTVCYLRLYVPFILCTFLLVHGQ